MQESDELFPVYLDYNSTTPLSKECFDVMVPFMTQHFGNASSSHHYGVLPKQAVKTARHQVAALINAEFPEEEIVFSGGGTEGINFALFGVARSLKREGKGNHIISCSFEHWAVSNTLKFLQDTEDFHITTVPVSEKGTIDVSQIIDAIREETILVTIMHANNEVGCLLPIEEIGRAIKVKKPSVIFHSDASQTAAKVEIDVQRFQVDIVNLAGHKFYGPKGIGATYVRKGVPVIPFVLGAKQERGLRGGTENVAAIVGMGKACEIAKRSFGEWQRHNRSLRDLLYQLLKEGVSDLVVNGDFPENILPNTLSVCFPRVHSQELLKLVDTKVAFSLGAACNSGLKASGSLAAMGVPDELALCAIRLSCGRYLKEAQVREAAQILVEAVKQLRGE